MTWSDMVSIAETGASVAVVISLIYVAIQVRLQANESRTTVINSLTQQWREALQSFALNGELYAIWMKGLVHFDSMTPEERGRFSAMLVSMTQIFECMHLQHREGKVDPGLWEGFDNRLKDVFATPGAQAWWRLRRHWHTPRFQEHVDAAIAACSGFEGRYVAIYGEKYTGAVGSTAAGPGLSDRGPADLPH